MPHIQVNDLQMYYERHGQGPTLVLIAGYTCDVHLWLPILDFLTPHFEVLIFDNRGCGRSDTTSSPYSIEMMGQDALHLLDALDISDFYLLGHSMGGCIAQWLGAHVPKRVVKMVIANSSAVFSTSVEMSFRFFYQLRELGVPLKLLIEGVLPWLYSPNYLREHAHKLVQLMLHQPYPQKIEGQKGQVDALLSFDSRPWLKSILAPTLIIAAEDDLPSPPKDGKFLADHIPNASFHLIPEMGHMPLIEIPEEFARLAIKFFT